MGSAGPILRWGQGRGNSGTTQNDPCAPTPILAERRARAGNPAAMLFTDELWQSRRASPPSAAIMPMPTTAPASVRIAIALLLLLAGGMATPLSTAAQVPVAPDAGEQARAQTDAAMRQMVPHLNAIGFDQLRAREAQLAAVTTREAAEARRARVRGLVEQLVGGVPASTGSVAVRRFGGADEDGFHLENLAYESLPGYWVAANVYVPPGPGPFPAVVMAPGHGAGKASNFAWAATLARTGILVLSIDPMGQGERMLHFDEETGASKVEPSGEHEHANQSALLIGQHIARYWFADGKRGVDYLVARGDVDARRIGTFGCSGGGTAAAYLAAMDDGSRWQPWRRTSPPSRSCCRATAPRTPNRRCQASSRRGSISPTGWNWRRRAPTP